MDVLSEIDDLYVTWLVVMNTVTVINGGGWVVMWILIVVDDTTTATTTTATTGHSRYSICCPNTILPSDILSGKDEVSLNRVVSEVGGMAKYDSTLLSLYIIKGLFIGIYD